MGESIMAQSSDVLDFGAFESSVTGQDIMKYVSFKKVVLFALQFIALPVIVTILYIVLGRLTPFIVVYILALVVVAIVAGTFYLRSVQRAARLAKFAELNNIRLTRKHEMPGLPGMIFNEGTSRQVNESLWFEDGVEIGNYQYRVNTGNGTATRRWAYMRIQLKKPLPHVVLDRRVNNVLGGILSNLPEGFKRNQAIKLEGNFNEYFDMYIPGGYQTDARYMFTPDVMTALIDNGLDYDLEIIDNNIFFYGKARPLDGQEIQNRLRAVNIIVPELLHQSRNYADERAMGSVRGEFIAAPGQRLKPGLRPTTILLIIVVVYMLAHMINAVAPLLLRIM